MWFAYCARDAPTVVERLSVRIWRRRVRVSCRYPERWSCGRGRRAGISRFRVHRLCCGIEGASLCSIAFTAAGEDVATVSVGLDPSTCSALPCGSFCCGTEGASLCSIGFAAAGEDAATASVGLDASTCSVRSWARTRFSLWNRRRVTLLDRFCGCGRGCRDGIGRFRSIDL